MNPIAFSVFGMDIRWYGILIGAGILVGLLLVKYTCEIKKLDYDTMLNMILIGLPVGIIGARLYYVAFNWDIYNGDLVQIFNIRGGGLAIHGGLIFGLAAGLIYAKNQKISFLEYIDAAVPSIAIAQAMGRWGNFFNSEAHGSSVSYNFIKHFPKFIQRGMHIDGVYYHPTFLYESSIDLMISGILILILRKSKHKGTVLFTYIFLYSLGRFFIESLRTDSLMLGPIKMAQFISVIGMVISLVYFAYSYIKKHH